MNRRAGGASPSRTRQELLTLREEDREENNPFSQSRTQDRLNQNGGSGTGIAAHGLGGLGSNQTHRHGRAKSSETDVKIARNVSERCDVHGFLFVGFYRMHPRSRATVRSMKVFSGENPCHARRHALRRGNK